MTKRDKLVQRIRMRPPAASFQDVRSLLEQDGWTLDRTSGSHHVFTKPGMRSFPVPVHNGVVIRLYLDVLCEMLELDDEHGTD